jgi:hypothetical protein
MTDYRYAGVSAALIGSFIPAHDETFDLAESIGNQLDEFREYVASVRDAEQADNAVTELLVAFKAVLTPEP